MPKVFVIDLDETLFTWIDPNDKEPITRLSQCVLDSLKINPASVHLSESDSFLIAINRKAMQKLFKRIDQTKKNNAKIKIIVMTCGGYIEKEVREIFMHFYGVDVIDEFYNQNHMIVYMADASKAILICQNFPRWEKELIG